MRGSRIYSDFNPEITWIRREIARDVRSLNPSLRSLARYYTEVRMRILHGRGVVWVMDRRMGRPIPYVAFWFADALGLTDRRIRRLSGLSLAQNMVAVAATDDVADSAPGSSVTKERLAQIWSRRYKETLKEIFPSEQGFSNATSTEEKECRRYRRWQSVPLAAGQSRPFSAGFLRESSRGPVADILPSLVAVAHAAGREEDVPRIAKFLWEFSMGWRIFDDLMDWESDLAAKDMNRSSVLIYIQDSMGSKEAMDRIDVLSWFLSDKFVGEAYGTMIGHFSNAGRAVASFGSPYLNQFIEEQISYQADKRDSLLASGDRTLSGINEGIASVLGPAKPRVGRRMREPLQ